MKSQYVRTPNRVYRGSPPGKRAPKARWAKAWGIQDRLPCKRKISPCCCGIFEKVWGVAPKKDTKTQGKKGDSIMKRVFFYNYPIGPVGIAEEDGAISRVFFGKPKAVAGLETAESPLIQKTAAQLTEYFDGKRKIFTVPLAPHGTDFQIAVWQALQTIPFGGTKNYGEVAALVGNAKACRAVGMANNRNPIVIIIPCHRVIGHNGSLTGYGGGLPAKQFLLDMEKRHA
jgi:methylated-DNA-[protein]-cysteine S-methyltransferase